MGIVICVVGVVVFCFVMGAVDTWRVERKYWLAEKKYWKER